MKAATIVTRTKARVIGITIEPDTVNTTATAIIERAKRASNN